MTKYTVTDADGFTTEVEAEHVYVPQSGELVFEGPTPTASTTYATAANGPLVAAFAPGGWRSVTSA